MLLRALSLLAGLVLAVHPAAADVRDLVVEPAKCPAAAYLVICPEKAVKIVERLARLHQQQGLVCRIVTAESLYAWLGRADATGISKFLRQLPREKLKFVLLVGSADPKAELLLPAAMAPAKYVSAALLSDDFFYSDLPFAQPSDDSPPDLAVGRLPARNVAELQVMVAHAVAASAVEGGPWQRRIEVAAGSAEVSPALDGLLDVALQQLIAAQRPAGLDVRFFSGQAGETAPSSDARQAFLQRLNAAPAMFIYIGHGRADAMGRLANQAGTAPVLEVGDCAGLTLPKPRTLLLAVACQSGDFVTEGSLCESLLAAKAGPGGCIAASGISQPYGNAVLANVLSESLADPPPTAGELLLRLRRGLWSRVDASSPLLDLPATALLGGEGMKAQIRDTAVMYNLLGDPAMPLGCAKAAASSLAEPPPAKPAASPAPTGQQKLKRTGGFD